MSIVALFDLSGYSVRPWAVEGAECYCLDNSRYIKPRSTEVFPSGGSIQYLYWDATDQTAKVFVRALEPSFMISMPPCTDLTVAGAKHFAAKLEANKYYLDHAMGLVTIAPELAENKIPYVMENPVGVISSNYRKPDYIFDPCDYGGYLPFGDTHPEWPDFIPSRDGYRKQTCIWGANGVIIPGQRRVPLEQVIDSQGRAFNPQTAKLGGKSEKTKQIRSLSPRGFFQALCEANFAKVMGREFEPFDRSYDPSVYYVSEAKVLN